MLREPNTLIKEHSYDHANKPGIGRQLRIVLPLSIATRHVRASRVDSLLDSESAPANFERHSPVGFRYQSKQPPNRGRGVVFIRLAGPAG